MQQEIKTLTGADIRQTSSVALDELGSFGSTADGRQFVYVGVGASQVAMGTLLVTPAVVANHQGLSLASSSNRAAGSVELRITLGNTAATQDQYADGYLTVVTGTGAGYAYKIKGNTLAAANGALYIELFQEEPLISAVDATSTFNLSINPYASLIATTTLGHAVGVATTTIAANSFGWAQTYGFASALIEGSIAKGKSISQSSTTAGAVTQQSGQNAIIGNTLEACTDTQKNSVWLQIT